MSVQETTGISAQFITTRAQGLRSSMVCWTGSCSFLKCHQVKRTATRSRRLKVRKPELQCPAELKCCPAACSGVGVFSAVGMLLFCSVRRWQGTGISCIPQLWNRIALFLCAAPSSSTWIASWWLFKETYRKACAMSSTGCSDWPN